MLETSVSLCLRGSSNSDFMMTFRTFAAALLLLAAFACVAAQAVGTEAQVERVRALYGAAKAREAAGDWAGAERAWEEVVGLAPEDARAWVNLGAARSHRDRREEAIAAWGRAISLDPTLAGAHFNLGLALVRGGEAAAAVAPLRRALALEPENEAARRALSVALVGAERYREASREIAQLLAREPRDPALLELAARSFMRQERYAEAVTVLRRRLDLGGETAELWAMYGDALDIVRRTPEAAEAYERAVKLDPESNRRRYALGYLYWQL